MRLEIVTIGESPGAFRPHRAARIVGWGQVATIDHASCSVTVVLLQQSAEARLTLDRAGSDRCVVFVRRLLSAGKFQDHLVIERLMRPFEIIMMGDRTLLNRKQPTAFRRIKREQPPLTQRGETPETTESFRRERLGGTTPERTLPRARWVERETSRLSVSSQVVARNGDRTQKGRCQATSTFLQLGGLPVSLLERQVGARGRELNTATRLPQTSCSDYLSRALQNPVQLGQKTPRSTPIWRPSSTAGPCCRRT